jgi:hypothetical protein
MTRILVVAQNELLGLVRSKFFILGILIMPILVGIIMAVMGYASSRVDRSDRRFAVVDHTGVLYPILAEAAASHDREVGEGPTRTGPHFLPEPISAETAGPDTAARLSERVRDGELFAFVEIPADVLDAGSSSRVAYYSQNTSSWPSPCS